MTALTKYDAAGLAVAGALAEAKAALTKAKSTGEVLTIKAVAAALQRFGREAKNLEIELDGAELGDYAVRRLGEFIRKQKGWLNPGTRTKGGGGRVTGGVIITPPVNVPTLADAGIDKNLAKRARAIDKLTEAEFEAKLAERRERVEHDGQRVTVDIFKGPARGTAGTGDNEWYTPAEFIHSAIYVMGQIDLDPASSEAAQRTVQAAEFYTAANDGLKRPWAGKVWLNPPYAQPLIAEFVAKLVTEVRAGNVSAAILLTHNSTDTTWFHEALSAAAAVCFTRGRISFVHANWDLASPTQGQAFFYFGPDTARFVIRFSAHGCVMVPAVQK